MSTCRAAILRAVRAFRGLAVGDAPTADELTVGLEAVQDAILWLHEARGPMTDIDVTADYTPGEDQRVRIQAGCTVTITLPNAVPRLGWVDPWDYGFLPPALTPRGGSLVAADGVQFRQPRDGARIEIVGTAQALYVYRADLNQWMTATGLGLDDELPLNARHIGAFAALVAQSLIDQWPGNDPPSPPPNLAQRVAAARAILLGRAGVARDPVMAAWL